MAHDIESFKALLLENAYELTLTVRMSARYHSLCERWFLKLNKLVTFSNVFLGSSVVGASLSLPKLAAGIGLLIAFLSALDVTLGTAQKASLHRDLYRRYKRLDGEIASQGLEADAILSRMRDIEVDEPPIIETFRIAAYRQNLAAHGQADHEPTIRPSWIQRLMLAFV